MRDSEEIKKVIAQIYLKEKALNERRLYGSSVFDSASKYISSKLSNKGPRYLSQTLDQVLGKNEFAELEEVLDKHMNGLEADVVKTLYENKDIDVALSQLCNKYQLSKLLLYKIGNEALDRTLKGLKGSDNNPINNEY